MTILRWIISIGVLIIHGSIPLAGQIPTTADERALALDIHQAIDYAMQHSQDLVALMKRGDVARAETKIEQELNNPSFIVEDTRSQPHYFVGGGYVFELGGKRSKRIKAATHEATIAGFNLTAGRRDLRHDVRIAFYSALQSRERRLRISDSRDLAEHLFTIAQQRFDAGDVAKFDVLQAALDLKRRENELKQADSDMKGANVKLNALLNRPLEDPIELLGSMEDNPPHLSLETLLDAAVAQKIEVMAIQQEILAEEARLALARAGRIPDLDVEAGVEINDADVMYGWRGALKMELPILNQKTGEINRSNALLESLRAEEASARLKARSEIVAAFLTYQAAHEQAVNYSKEILPAADEIKELSQESYHEGKTGILAALDAQRSMHEVRLEYLDTLMNFQTALADLEQAAGVDIE